MGVLHSNALAFLPALTEGQISALQTAMNAGIRAVLNLPRKSIISMTTLRVKHGFLSVTDVRDKCLMLAAQKNRDNYMQRTHNMDGPNTRAKSRGEIPHPNCKGQIGLKTSTAIDKIWNRIPKEIRDEPSFEKAARKIKQLFHHRRATI